MAEQGSVSIIATSYNQRRTLEVLLASLKRQTHREFEVVVADDGSSDGTAEFCVGYSGLKLRFVTQADDGYRKSRILNEAVHCASGDYLIFIDSDVVLEKHFVEDHLFLRSAGSFVCGRRVDVGEALSSRLGVADVEKGFFDGLSARLLLSAWQGETLGWKRALRVTRPKLRRFLGYDKPIDILGSNLGLWKKDLLEVNGFNEAMQAYWGEDGDLFVRLRNTGKKSISAKGYCVQFHLFHPRREPSLEHQAQVGALLRTSEYRRATQGYDSRFSL